MSSSTHKIALVENIRHTQYHRYSKPSVLKGLIVQSLSRPKRDDVRAAILASAAETFLKEGFQRASLAAIAQRAGFTKGAVYSNFGSKPELFMEAWQAQVEERHDDVIAMLSEQAGKTQSEEEFIDAVSRTLAQSLDIVAPWEILLAQVRMLARKDEKISEIYQKIYEERIRIVSAAVSRHPLAYSRSEAQLRAFAISLISLVNILCLEDAAQPHFQSIEERTQLFRYCIQGAIA